MTAMMPGSDTLPSVADLGLVAFVDKFWVEAPWMFWLGSVGSCFAFMISPLFTVYLPVPAVFLSANLLDRHASAMANHRIYILRQTGMMVKMLAGLHWAAAPEVRARFGLVPYPPDPDTWRTS